MTVFFLNLIPASLMLIILFRGIKKGYIKMDRLRIGVLLIGLIVGLVLFDIHRMCVWTVLLFHSYTDSIEETVYYHITLAGIAGEIIYAVISRVYMNMPVYTLLFPSILIVALSKLAHAYADADMELFFLLMLMAYNREKIVAAYMVCYFVFTCVMFLAYMIAINIARKIRHGELTNTGAFVPAMAAAFLIVEFVNCV